MSARARLAPHAHGPTEEARRERKLLAARVALLLLFVGAAAFVATRVLARGLTVDALREEVASYGAWAPALYFGFYAVGALVIFPATLLTLGAGALWGFWPAVLLATTGSAAGAVLAFLVSRKLGGGFVESLVGTRVRVVTRMLGDEGLLTVFLLRVLPVLPFGLVSYGFGLTRVRHPEFLLGTVLGMLPGTILYAAIAAEAVTVTSPWDLLTPGIVVPGLGLLTLTGATLWWARRRGKPRAT